MPLSATTTGGGNASVGVFNMQGEWAGFTHGANYPVRLSFQFGYGSFGQTTGYDESFDASGSYSRNANVDTDRTLKFRARAYNYKTGETGLGGSGGEFKTLAGTASFPYGPVPGTPTDSSCSITGSAIPNTTESTGSVSIEYRVGAGAWTPQGGALASGISGGSAFPLSTTLTSLLPATLYEVRFRIDRNTENLTVIYSNSGFFTTAGAGVGVNIEPQTMLASAQAFAPTLPMPLIVTVVPMEVYAEAYPPEIVAVLLGQIEDFLREGERREIVLIEVTPSIILRGWINPPADLVVNTWRIPLSRKYLEDLFPGGIYRKVVGVRQNFIDLTRNPTDEIPTVAGRWFWDEGPFFEDQTGDSNATDGMLFVRTTTPQSPDNYVALQVFVTYYIATTGIVLNLSPASSDTGIFYHPWLSGDLPRLSQYMEDPLQGVKVTEGGAVGLTNTHGFWNRAIPEHNWKNKKVRLLFGGEYAGKRLARTQYIPLTTMLVDDISATEEQASILLKPGVKQLDMELPITPYFETEYPFLGDGVLGTKKWLGWGRAIIPPDLTDTSGFGVWTVADASFQTLAALHAVYARAKSTGVITTLQSADYSVNLALCTITIVNPAYSWTSHVISCDVTGKEQNTFATIVNDILFSLVGVKIEDFDFVSFYLAGLDAPQKLSVWLKQSRTISSLLATTEQDKASLERSVMGNLRVAPDGKWRVTIWQPGKASGVSLRREDFVSFMPQPRLKLTYSTVRAHYDFDHAAEQWGIEQATDVKTACVSETSDRLDVFTFLTESSDALALAQKALLLAGASPVEVEFEERGAILAESLAGDIVRVTYDPMPVSGGKATTRAFELIRLDRSLNPMLTITGRLLDLRNLGAHIGHVSPERFLNTSGSLATNWFNADDNNREQYGWVTDANGYLDPTDEGSVGLSVVW